MPSTNAELVRQMMTSYLDQDLDTAERLLAQDLRFSSPQDDHIDRATYLDRCFPTRDRVRWQTLMEVVELDASSVFIRYEYELNDGGRFRNAEVITVRDGQIHEIEVYFGGPTR
jgi:ketosteroid isomerase-like protein